jgi:hypothetical protein
MNVCSVPGGKIFCHEPKQNCTTGARKTKARAEGNEEESVGKNGLPERAGCEVDFADDGSDL